MPIIEYKKNRRPSNSPRAEIAGKASINVCKIIAIAGTLFTRRKILPIRRVLAMVPKMPIRF